jgi:hypothetical protein
VYFVPHGTSALELGNKMVTQKDKCRVEVLFIPFLRLQTKVVGISGRIMSNPGMEKGFFNNQQLGL